MGAPIAEPVPGVKVAAAALPAPTWVEAAFQDIFDLSEEKRQPLLAKALILATRLSTSQAVTNNADFIDGMRAIKGPKELEHVLAIIQALMDRKPEGTDEQTASDIIQTAIDAGKSSAAAATDRVAGRRAAATGRATEAAKRAGQDELTRQLAGALHPAPPSVLKF